MPMRQHLQGHGFDPETARLLGLAFEMALVALQHADRVVSPTRDAVAQKIIELAKAGERDPGRLCDAALEALGASPALTDPSPLPPPASPPVPPGS
jgi:hypothetical protein